MVDRLSVDASAFAGAPQSFVARAELGAFEIPVESEEEWVAFLTCTCT
jgi:hypothetical protein